MCQTAASVCLMSVVLAAFENLALGMDFLSMFVADARTDESAAFYADRLFSRLAAAHSFLKGYRDANAGMATRRSVYRASARGSAAILTSNRRFA